MSGDKKNTIRVSDEAGNAFIAVADLLGRDKNKLLEDLMTSYVESVKLQITKKGTSYPQFVSEFPFVQH